MMSSVCLVRYYIHPLPCPPPLCPSMSCSFLTCPSLCRPDGSALRMSHNVVVVFCHIVCVSLASFSRYSEWPLSQPGLQCLELCSCLFPRPVTMARSISRPAACRFLLSCFYVICIGSLHFAFPACIADDPHQLRCTSTCLSCTTLDRSKQKHSSSKRRL